MEGGQALGGGEETLPCPHEGTIKWPWGKEKKDRLRDKKSTEVSHGANTEIMTSICLLENFKQAQMQPFNKNQAVIST